MAALNIYAPIFWLCYIFQVCEFVDCGSPPELLNGAIELVDGRTTYGAEIEYSCGSDYTLSGEKIRR